MANQYVQFGAAVALGVGAVGAKAAAGVLSNAASSGYNQIVGATASAVGPVPVYGGVGGAIDAMSGVAGTAGTSALSAMSNVVTNPAFLTGVGLSLAGLVLGSGFKRPSLNLPNVAAATAVALNVNNLIQQGKAAAASYANLKAGLDIQSTIGQGLALSKSNAGILYDTINKSRESGKTLPMMFPADLSTEYFIRFAFYDYSRLELKEKNSFTGIPHTTIRLPVPSNLIDAINLAYSDVNMGQFGGAIYNSIVEGKSSSDLASRSWQTLLGDGVGGIAGAMSDPGFMQALMRRVASSVDPGLGTAFDLATGTTPNPHVALAFNGIALKRYQFTWKFSPNSLKESKELHNIIRLLQIAAMPTKQGDFMLGFPNVVRVDMSPSNIFIFKKMMMDNVAVNYAPNGVPSFFANRGNLSRTAVEGTDNSQFTDERYPTEVQITISLREMSIHTANDSDWQNLSGSIRGDNNIVIGGAA